MATVLITGAAGVLGRALARGFAAAGADLILHGRDRAEELAAVPLPGANSLRVWTADLADAAAVARASLGPVDILINAAAAHGPIGPLENNDPDAWMSAVAVDLFAPMLLARACLPGMKARRFGRIINLSGGGAAAPRPFFSAYGAAKAALARLTETLALELKDTGVTVNAVAPGPMASGLTRDILRAGELAGDQELAAARKYAEQPGYGPEKAVALCLWLASDQSRGITGRLISAQWDDWAAWPGHLAEMGDLYTLRRITGRDRGQTWGDK